LIIARVKPTLVLASLDYERLARELCQNTAIVSSGFVAELGTRYEVPCSVCIDMDSSVYAVFTSGTTGIPKGVVISHRSIAAAVHYQVPAFQYTSQSRIYDFSPYSFDAAILDAFLAFGAGGCLCLPSDDDRKNNLTRSIRALQANTVFLTPSVARLLTPSELPGVVVILGGEAISAKDIEPWWDNVFTIYGPSECTPVSLVNPNPLSTEHATRLGKGCGVNTWVVHPDNHNLLLPPGCVGELLLEGPLVDSGHYLRDPENTAEVFIETPKWLLRGHARVPGRRGRLYKTGDLVTYNEDGSLSFVGRKGLQVKIHGQRVELSEVENWVQEYIPEAEQVVVDIIHPKDDGSNSSLAAFLQISDPNDQGRFQSQGTRTLARAAEVRDIFPVSADIETKLSQHLPTYMIPHVFFRLPKLPLATTFKTDRKRLREFGSSLSSQELAALKTAGQGPKEQPTTQLERQMQTIWARVLQIDADAIGLDDSFFKLGGDSIAAMKVVAEASRIRITLTVADIFQRQSLRAVAGACARSSSNTFQGDPEAFSLLGIDVSARERLIQDTSEQYNVEQTSIKDIYPCTPLQEGLPITNLQATEWGIYPSGHTRHC